MRVLQVVFNHAAAEGLPTDVPDLQSDLAVAGQVQAAKEEVGANGLLVRAAEVVAREAVHNGGLNG